MKKKRKQEAGSRKQWTALMAVIPAKAGIHVWLSNVEVLRITGGVMLGLPASELVRGAMLSGTTHGIPAEVLERDEI
ncbi:MAG TPA: hypothetical protein VFK39_16110, partial [Gemmatimonadaceae bacterium]|nr:hypothetical protein [Gemmatimonadaceae bacterium]